MSVWQVWQNFVAVVEGISPTFGDPDRGFYYYDPEHVDPSIGVGERSFTLRWLDSDADREPTCTAERIADHLWELEVVYTVGPPNREMHELFLSDRNDILKALRDDRNWFGPTDYTDTTQNIGLFARRRVRDEFDRADPATHYYRTTWMTTIVESENA